MTICTVWRSGLVSENLRADINTARAGAVDGGGGTPAADYTSPAQRRLRMRSRLPCMLPHDCFTNQFWKYYLLFTVEVLLLLQSLLIVLFHHEGSEFPKHWPLTLLGATVTLNANVDALRVNALAVSGARTGWAQVPQDWHWRRQEKDNHASS